MARKQVHITEKAQPLLDEIVSNRKEKRLANRNNMDVVAEAIELLHKKESKNK